MAKQNESEHEGLTIIICRELHEYEKEELKELVDNYKHNEGNATIGFF